MTNPPAWQSRARQEMLSHCHAALMDAIQAGRVDESINWLHQVWRYSRLLNPGSGVWLD